MGKQIFRVVCSVRGLKCTMSIFGLLGFVPGSRTIAIISQTCFCVTNENMGV